MKTRWIILPVWVGFFLLGCGGSSPTTRLGEPGPWEVRIVSGGDTMNVPTEGNPASGVSVRQVAVGIGTPAPGKTADVLIPASLPDESSERSLDDFTFGYRIQISANEGSMMLAEERKAEADSLYTIPAYIEYERGWYKVRLGDFLTREEAEVHMVSLKIRERYNKAFIAETYVLKPRP